MSNIYQQIWNSDRHKFSVSPRDNNGGWLDSDADILLDEQVQASGRQDLDLASKPLFYRVNEAKFNISSTYSSLFNLLDNYRFDNRQSEVVTRAEKAEIDQFIADICQTDVMAITRQYLTEELKVDFAHIPLEAQLKSIWFGLYTNYFGNSPVKDASGFEHIFVGEGHFDYSSIAENAGNKISGVISGYHSWIKFYLDERQNQSNYLGHNYEVEGKLGIENPYIVTVQMLWRGHDQQSNLPIELFKKKGCFFIGTSPECEIAMGTVAYFESLANYKFHQEKRSITINGANYDLALYRNLQPDSTRGNHIRSFYPIYLG